MFMRSYSNSNNMQNPDYHAAGLNIINNRTANRFSELDCVYQHPKTGAKFFIGNITAAQNLSILNRESVTRVVNCQDLEAENFHERKQGMLYFRFPISHWWRERGMDQPRNVLRYFKPYFSWVDHQLSQGSNVMVHCLAGAHRAGTAGVAYCMYANRKPYRESLVFVKNIRPIVDPFGPLSELLDKLEKALVMLPRDALIGECNV